MINKHLLFLIPSLLTLASCSSTEEEIVKQDFQRKIVASQGEGNQIGRTSFVEGDDGTMKGIFWTPADQIGVFSVNGSENACFNTSTKETVPTTTFSGTLEEQPRYAYYPYSVENSSVSAIQGTLPAVQEYSSTDGKLHYDYKYGTLRGVFHNDYKFSFTNFFAMIRFEINATGSELSHEQLQSVTLSFPQTVQFLTGSFEASAMNGDVAWPTDAVASHELTVKWTDQPAMLAGKTIYGYLFVDAKSGLKDKELKVILATDKRNVTFKSRLLLDEFKPNFIYNVPLTLQGWEDSFDNPIPDDGGLHYGGGAADDSQILSTKLDLIY